MNDSTVTSVLYCSRISPEHILWQTNQTSTILSIALNSHICSNIVFLEIRSHSTSTMKTNRFQDSPRTNAITSAKAAVLLLQLSRDVFSFSSLCLFSHIIFRLLLFFFVSYGLSCLLLSTHVFATF